MTDRTKLAGDLADERRGSAGRHPSDDELALFAAGDLPAEDRDRIEEHVAACDRGCGRRLLAAFDDLEAFESSEPVAGEPAYLSHPEEIEARGRALAGELARPSSPAPWRRHLAMAMAVLAGMVGGYLVGELLEGPQARVTRTGDPPASEQIVVGDGFATLIPDESRDRSGRDSPPVVADGTGDLILLLQPPPRADAFPGEVLVIEGVEDRRLSLAVDRSQAHERYGLTVRIPRHLVPSGRYRLTLAGGDEPIATYHVEIRTTPRP